MAATSRDVAEYFLRAHGPLDTWKLQKLVYYTQAWHLALHDAPAFDDEIQAFVDGPVARDLFSAHQNQRYVSRIWKGTPSRLNETTRVVADEVWSEFGDETGAALRELSHVEIAWLEAREGLDPEEPSDRPLSHATMASAARSYLKTRESLPEPTDEHVQRGTAGILKYLADSHR